MADYIPFLVILALLAIVLRDDTVMTLFYLLAGVYFAGRWWRDRAFKAVTYKRVYVDRAFLGERVTVRLEVSNAGWLPVVWLRLHDSLPVELAAHRFFQEVVTLGPREHKQFDYVLETYKRGYYRIGPLLLYSGDLLGLAEERDRFGAPGYLTVYPHIVPLTSLRLPSHSPLGTLHHHQPIFEDPTRVTGKRDYVSGDSLRRVDWKATAAIGRLQVKQFEPSIALETYIFLNLNGAEYAARSRFDATELSIVIAASIANWVAGKKQSVGMLVNGADPLADDARPPALPPRKGRHHLMRLLDVLARVKLAEMDMPLPEVLRRELVSLPWGTTLVIITGLADEALFDALFQARRSGLDAVLVLTSPVAGFEAIKRRLEHFGFPVYHLTREQDLDVWRR
jgi:uncharacterized protein (DUF58 family)